MSARYVPLPNPDTERELDDAFDPPDNHDADEDIHAAVPNPIPGAYDFERDYDYPPPGSPPRPTSRALPNDYGNSNGLLPTAPPAAPPVPRPSVFRRAVGALLPSHYVRVPTSDTQSSIPRGGGTENDGVFANVSAKPQRAARVVQNPDGSIYMVPEDNQKDVPPSYADAQADAVPPYWETTVHAPATQDLNGNMIIDDLPTGPLWVFASNLLISFFFQFVGFLFTYLLHTSHAAKFGSRAGLGLTLIQFGFYSRSMSLDPGENKDGADPIPSSRSVTAPALSGDPDTALPIVSSKDWLAFLFMTLGWFLFLSSAIGYWRVKRWEKSIRAASTPPTAEDIQRDIEIRRNISLVFGVSFGEDENVASTRMAPMRAADARLERELRAAGIL